MVFDLDGTLSRSMEQHYAAYLKILQPLGITPTFHDVCLLEGKRSAEVIAILCHRMGKPISEEEAKRLGDAKQRAFREAGLPPLYPGARTLLDGLAARGISLGVATGTSRENVRHMLGVAMERFAAVLTGEEMTKTKPDPEAYVRTFQALGISPNEGIVVENAPLGVEAGKRAGARVVGVTHTLPAPYLWEADIVVATLDAAQAWIQQETAEFVRPKA
ncbi:MAG: HAD family hydrolase [Thermoplasmatota archaeon]